MKLRQPLKIIPALSVAAVVSFATSFAQAGQADTAVKLTTGAQVYEKICSYCHETGIGPVIKGRQLPQVYIKHVVRNGNKAMPAFRVSDFDDKALAELADAINTSRVAKK
jgi:4-cresol dehydrogenase (hydroxylating) cytochrome subunit